MELVNTSKNITIDAKLRICCKECKQYVDVEPVIENDYTGCYYEGEHPDLIVRAECTICGTTYETNIY